LQRLDGCPLSLAKAFVDGARFTGACSRAANGQVVGTTRGFARRNGRYASHGAPKQALVYPLHRRARTPLCAATLPATWTTPMPSVALTGVSVQDLQLRLSTLPNGRRPLLGRGQTSRRIRRSGGCLGSPASPVLGLSP
jgi:hypothetical protein